MSKLKIVVFVFLSLHLIKSDQLTAQDKLSVAVLPLQGNGISLSETSVLTDELRSVMVQTGKYIVVERSSMESILKEQGFQMSGCTSAECAVEAGKLLGVNKMVTGSVGKLGELYNINLRLFDVGTGQIEKTEGQKHEGSVEELLDVIHTLGMNLTASTVTVSSDQLSEKPDMETGRETSGPPALGNRFGLWFSWNLPRTSLISEGGKGFGAGLYYKAHLIDRLFIQPELSYSTAEFEYYGPDDILQFEYFHITAILCYEITSNTINNFVLSINAGISMNSVLAAQEKYEGDVADLKSEIADNNFSLIFGVGLGIQLGKVIINLEPRYALGMSTIFNDDTDWEVGKSQIFSFLVGISF